VHLCDVQLEEGQEPAPAAADDDNVPLPGFNERSLEDGALLLGMDAEVLRDTLRFKKIKVPGRGSFHKIARTEAQCRQTVHSLVKALYKRLFDRTVKRINDSFQELQAEGGGKQAERDETRAHMGILDIYGFEQLQVNSFEQLCINLANERLQQYFVENVLIAEQTIYTREGLPWTELVLPDSQPVVRAVAIVFQALDDFSSRQAKGFDSDFTSDEKFNTATIDQASKDSEGCKVLKALKIQNKRNSSSQKKPNEGFIIQHYAGEVFYTTKGWLDKNNDRLEPVVEALIAESESTLVQSLAEEDQGGNPFRSISKKYSADLEALLQTLSSAQLHYVRCFKPNELQVPDVFNKSLVLEQIVQCGTIELVKIMHDGYPNRCAFDEIVGRYKALLPDSFQRYGTRTFIEALMLAYEVPRTQWDLGITRLFLKSGQLKMLESMREGGAKPDPDKLKAIVKDIVRKKWSRAHQAISFCLWVPKMVGEIRVRRAAKELAVASVAVGRLALHLEAAKERVRQRRLVCRRKLVGAVRLVAWCAREAREYRARRHARLVTSLYRWAFLRIRVQPWVLAGRRRAGEARELALEEGIIRRAEEAQEAAERLAKEAEAAKLAMLARQRGITPQECQKQLSQEQAAKKDKATRCEEEDRATEAGLSTCAATSVPGTGVSEAEVKEAVRQEMERQLAERESVFQQKQAELLRRVQELQEQNDRLEKQRTEDLVAPRTPQAGREEAPPESFFSLAQGTPPGLQQQLSQRTGVLPPKAPGHREPVPGGVPGLGLGSAASASAACHPLQQAPRLDPLQQAPRLGGGGQSARRYSMMGLHATGAPGSASRAARRRSIAGVEMQAACTSSASKLPGTPGGNAAADGQEDTKELSKQRRWWAEQRGFLMEDLYPRDSGAASPASVSRGSVAGRRASVGGYPGSARGAPGPRGGGGDGGVRPRNLAAEL